MNSPLIVLVVMFSFIIISIVFINLKVNGIFDRFFDWFKKILKRK